jgi:conjugal transfer pilus assembly protein TraI
MAQPVQDVSGLPAADPGFAALPVADLLTSAEELIARIRLCFGIDRDSFESEVQPLLQQYAAYVHLLPATADNYFSTPGGLLRLGLEVGFFSLQGTDAHIFAGRSTISARRQLEPRWRYATFIGGLCCELHRVLSHVIVTDAAGEQWPAYLQPLSVWLADRSADRYFVRWRPNAVEARGLGVFALPLVVPASRLQYLNEDNAVIVPHLLASIGGVPVYREQNVLDRLVRRALALVVDRNLQANADRHGAPQVGSHLERHLVDALRRLATSNSTWVPNREKSRVWFGSDGLFLAWPQSADDVQALLEADQLPGIPKAPETILELLLAAGVCEATGDGHPTWSIYPPDAKAPLMAVKLSSSAILFAGEEAAPTPLGTQLLRAVSEPAVARAAPHPPPDAAPGTQYSLIDAAITREAPDAAAVTDAAVPVSDAPPPSPPPRPPEFRLNAPLRLNSAVHDALAAIVHTLNGPGSAAAACAVADGLFVPLHELQRRGIQPALAARALAEVRLLVHKDRSRAPTVSRAFAGQPTVGLVMVPSCVEGFDRAAFTSTAEQ